MRAPLVSLTTHKVKRAKASAPVVNQAGAGLHYHLADRLRIHPAGLQLRDVHHHQSLQPVGIDSAQVRFNERMADKLSVLFWSPERHQETGSKIAERCFGESKQPHLVISGNLHGSGQNERRPDRQPRAASRRLLMPAGGRSTRGIGIIRRAVGEEVVLDKDGSPMLWLSPDRQTDGRLSADAASSAWHPTKSPLR